MMNYLLLNVGASTIALVNCSIYMHAYFLRPHIYTAKLSRVLQNLVKVPCNTSGQASRMQRGLPRGERPLGWQHPEPHTVLVSLSHKIIKSNPGMAFSTTLSPDMELDV